MLLFCFLLHHLLLRPMIFLGSDLYSCYSHLFSVVRFFLLSVCVIILPLFRFLTDYFRFVVADSDSVTVDSVYLGYYSDFVILGLYFLLGLFLILTWRFLA